MKNMRNLWIDVAALVVYLVVANPAITGLALHEWVSVGVFVVFVVHAAVHYEWVVATCKAAFETPSWATTGNLVLGVVILLLFCLDVVSGMLLSRHILPQLGLFATGYFVWKPIHALASKTLLALLIVHVALHWKWFAGLLGRKGK